MTGRLKNNLWFSYIAFLLCWAICGYSFIGSLARKHELFAVKIDHHPYISDFVIYYNAAKLAEACQKEKIDIYSPVLQGEYAKKLTAPVVAEQPFYLQYPPYWFSLVLPLAFFDMLTAWSLWCIVGVTLMIFLSICLIRNSCCTELQQDISAAQSPAGGSKIFGIGKFTLAFVITALLASFPTWECVKMGQTALLMIPGIVTFWLCCKNRRYFYAGLASIVAMIKLQYLPPVFLIGLLLGRWRFLGGFTLVGVMLLALAIGTLGADNVLRFPQALLQGESGHTVSGVAPEEMQNVRGNLLLILGTDNNVVHIITIVVFALALAVLTFFWWRASKTFWSESNRDKDINQVASCYRVLASISMLVILVVSPHCHTQDYLALVIPCIWLWFEAAKLKRMGRTSRSISLLQGLILFFPVLGWPFFIFKNFFHLAKIQPFFLWAVLVIILSYRLYLDLKRQTLLYK